MPQTPHDALFKATFSKLEHARAMLRSELPERLSSLVNWASLKRRPGSFVDEALSEQHTDLLFTARLGKRPAYFYLLFEHQSTADRWMLLRLLQYMVRIWQEHLAKDPGAAHLPVIVPVVLHHSETGWTCATAFQGLMDLDDETRAEALAYVPCFELVLDDVSRVSDDDLRGRAITALGKLVLACLRHARDMRTLLARLDAWSNTMAETRRAPNGMRAFALVLRYMFGAVSDLEPAEIRAMVEGATDPEVAEEIVSLAEKLREEGLQKGLERGLQQGLQKGLQQGLQKGLQQGLQKGLQQGREEQAREVLLKLLRLKFGKVPAASVARVRAANMAELERWTELVLTAPSVAEVLRG